MSAAVAGAAAAAGAASIASSNAREAAERLSACQNLCGQYMCEQTSNPLAFVLGTIIILILFALIGFVIYYAIKHKY